VDPVDRDPDPDPQHWYEYKVNLILLSPRLKRLSVLNIKNAVFCVSKFASQKGQEMMSWYFA
jgi:hypothetical protein